jgi:hypothetical protein
MRTVNPLGIVLIVLGIILLIFGFSAADSVGSHVHRFFTGNPTDRTMWLMIGGGLSLIVGLALTFAGPRRIA